MMRWKVLQNTQQHKTDWFCQDGWMKYTYIIDIKNEAVRKK